MFSSRLNWSVSANPIARLIDQKRASGATILDLTVSNPTAAGFTYPAEPILNALADARSLVYEPEPAGIPAARAAVSDYYSARVSADRILITASTSEAYAFLFKLLCDPGDEVLVPRPSYPLFEFLADLEAVRVIHYPLVYHGEWAIDFAALEHAVTGRTRAIVLVNPNNPTGSFLKKEELGRLTALCRKHDLAIISDEVFSDYVFEEDSRRVRSLIEVEDVLTFSMSGLSKVAGLPQLKFGWIVISGPAELRRRAFENLELIADTYLSVASPVQWAAGSLLGCREQLQPQIADRIRANFACLQRALPPNSPWSVLKAEGGWYATLQAPRIRSEEEWVLTLLAQDNVLVQPGFFFDFATEAFLVASLLTPVKVFKEGVRRILAHTDAEPSS